MGDKPEDMSAKLAEALLIIQGNMAQIGEAVDGYRAQCIERGYSPTASEKMAMDYHEQLTIAIFKG